MVRKSLFQRLEPWDGQRVCDLYAGIGTLGIEALSRGARHVTFVEDDPAVCAVLERNLARASAGDRSQVVPLGVESFLKTTPQTFDVVLADPPYDTTRWQDLQPVAERVLAPGGVFMMELAAGAPLPNDVDARVHGGTKVALWRLPA